MRRALAEEVALGDVLRDARAEGRARIDIFTVSLQIPQIRDDGFRRRFERGRGGLRVGGAAEKLDDVNECGFALRAGLEVQLVGPHASR